MVLAGSGSMRTWVDLWRFSHLDAHPIPDVAITAEAFGGLNACPGWVELGSIVGGRRIAKLRIVGGTYVRNAGRGVCFEN